MKNKQQHFRRLQYGVCHICGGDIDNAGLDHNHCSKCGWVVDSAWLKGQVARKSEPLHRKRVEKHIDNVAHISQSGAGSVLGIGGGTIAANNSCSDWDVFVGDGDGSEFTKSA